MNVILKLTACFLAIFVGGCASVDGRADELVNKTSEQETPTEDQLAFSERIERLEQELEIAKKENKKLRIQPAIGVGPIKFGMTSKELNEAIGAPLRRTGTAYEYQRLGLAVMMDQDDKVQVIRCGAWCEPSDILIDVFKGVTDKGIRMRSTEEEIISAYGQPAVIRNIDSGFELLKYDGMHFALRSGKLVHMTFLRPTEGAHAR